MEGFTLVPHPDKKILYSSAVFRSIGERLTLSQIWDLASFDDSQMYLWADLEEVFEYLTTYNPNVFRGSYAFWFPADVFLLENRTIVITDSRTVYIIVPDEEILTVSIELGFPVFSRRDLVFGMSLGFSSSSFHEIKLNEAKLECAVIAFSEYESFETAAKHFGYTGRIPQGDAAAIHYLPPDMMKKRRR